MGYFTLLCTGKCQKTSSQFDTRRRRRIKRRKRKRKSLYGDLVDCLIVSDVSEKLSLVSESYNVL